MSAGPNRHQQQSEDATLPAELPHRPLLLYHPKVFILSVNFPLFPDHFLPNSVRFTFLYTLYSSGLAVLYLDHFK